MTDKAPERIFILPNDFEFYTDDGEGLPRGATSYTRTDLFEAAQARIAELEDTLEGLEARFRDSEASFKRGYVAEEFHPNKRHLKGRELSYQDAAETVRDIRAALTTTRGE